MTPAQAAVKMRADLLERSGFACEYCEAKDVELQVHHRYYNSQAYHGDYPADSLEVLCVACHLEADKLRRKLCKCMGKMHTAISQRALGYMEALVLEDEWEHPDTEIPIRSAEHAHGIADAFGLTEDEVFGLAGPSYRITLRQVIQASPLRRYTYARETLAKEVDAP